MKQLQLKKAYIEIISALFILLFLYTAIMKLKNIPSFIIAMRQVPLLHAWANLLAGFIPGVEIATVILLLIPATKYIGLVIATGFMAILTAYVFYILLTMSKLPCSCGGVIQQMTWRQHLIFNLVLTGLGMLGIYRNKKMKYLLQ